MDCTERLDERSQTQPPLPDKKSKRQRKSNREKEHARQGVWQLNRKAAKRRIRLTCKKQESFQAPDRMFSPQGFQKTKEGNNNQQERKHRNKAATAQKGRFLPLPTHQRRNLFSYSTEGTKARKELRRPAPCKRDDGGEGMQSCIVKSRAELVNPSEIVL